MQEEACCAALDDGGVGVGGVGGRRPKEQQLQPLLQQSPPQQQQPTAQSEGRPSLSSSGMTVVEEEEEKTEGVASEVVSDPKEDSQSEQEKKSLDISLEMKAPPKGPVPFDVQTEVATVLPVEVLQGNQCGIIGKVVLSDTAPGSITSRQDTFRPPSCHHQLQIANDDSLAVETRPASTVYYPVQCRGEEKGGGVGQASPPFGYSQKNFHIADGNLYSILTPFQAKAASSRQSSFSSASPGAQSEKGEKGAATAPRARGRRRAKWKLKFHHQALPPEYLDHYEAAMAQEAKAAAAAAAAEAATSPPVPSLIRIEKAMAPEAGSSKGTSGGRSSSSKGGRRVPNFIQDLQLKEPHDQRQLKTTANQCGQYQSEAAEWKGKMQTEEPSAVGTCLLVKAFPMSETTVSSSVSSKSSPDLSIQPEEKRSSVIIASGLAGSRSDGPSTSSLRDLPYMGEMTLDTKPRRGRKPKKADICHLIYKNYGNVFVPSNNLDTTQPRSVDSGTAASSPAPSSPSSTASSLSPSSSSGTGKPEVGHKSFSATDSLLAKRLTQAQNSRRVPSQPQEGSLQDEPLNLCIRDLKRINVSGPFFPIKTEPVDGTDEKSEVPAKRREGETEPGASGATTISVANNASFPGVAAPVAGNYIYWPNAGVFVHPMALQSHLLYCQKMGAAAAVAAATAASIPLISPAVMPEKPKQRVGDIMATVEAMPIASLSIPGTSSQDCQEIPQNASFSRAVTLRPAEVARIPANSEEVPSASPSGRKRIVHSTSLATKRKRSAIFIPPTAENPTEVSICKFKFTGGAKPSLEEKKMLSVDAGGNFRYYSGTGDKSMRGYEFFPREQTLQQQYMGSSIGSLISTKPPTPSSTCPASSTPSAVTSSSSSPVTSVVNTQHYSSEPASPLLSTIVSSDGAVVRGDQTSVANRTSSDSLPFHRQGVAFPVAGGSGESGTGVEVGQQGDRKGSSSSSGTRRKRRTRKSLVREKLEQTFREKGFLIQTQQLESAEGATYCKFRQLRKFTRYLFRSWKDYLPGNIKEISSTAMPPGGGRPESNDSTCVQPSADGTPANCPPHE